MDTTNISILLNRYQQGQSSAEENGLVESWLEDNGVGSTEWKNMNELSRKQYLFWLYDNIQKNKLPDGRSPVRIYKLNFWRIISSTAALFLVACGLFLTWTALNRLIKPVSWQVKTTTRIPELVILEDGSRVWLNSASKLKYPVRFTGDTREVYLEGEAFFEVEHKAGKPFLVHAADLTTKVLGTVFTVRAYAGDADSRIVLKSGKVKVVIKEHDEKKGVMLLPGQMASYNRAGGPLLKTNVSNADEYSAWKDGKLIFNETPIVEVLHSVGRAYGVRIGFKGKKIRECTITGSFNVNQDLEDILKSISISVEGVFTKEAGRITLSGEEFN